MRRAAVAIATVALIGGACSPVAAAQEPDWRQTAKAKFTQTRPGAPTGIVFKVDYVNPQDPAAKPPAVRKVVETLARGARFDTSAPELCSASDLELMLLGTSACPVGSQVGAGHLTLDTGLPAPARFLDVEVDFFNNTDEFIFLNQITALDVPRVVVRSTVRERQYVNAAPFVPGTPPDGAAIDTVAVRQPVVTREVGGESRSYVTTPPTCPERGFWVNRVQFTYFDGVSQTVRSRTACRHATRPSPTAADAKRSSRRRGL